MASTTQRVGGAVGLAVVIAVAGAGLDLLHGEALRVATSDGLRTATFVAAAATLAGALVAAGLRRPTPEPAVAPSPPDGCRPRPVVRGRRACRSAPSAPRWHH